MKVFGIILLTLAMACAIGAIEAFLTMMLWNYVLCTIFTTIPTISFKLAWGVLLILNVIKSLFVGSGK